MGNPSINILIIHSDQHRADCLGANGNKQIQTPNIDRLAADGINYHECFTPYPLCTPARFSLLTGLYVHQHLGGDNRSAIPSGLQTFPKVLKENGFHTACVGKMHFSPTYLDVGFQEMFLAEQDGPGRLDDDYHRELMEKGLVDGTDLQDQVSGFRRLASTEYSQNFGTKASDLPEEWYSTGWIGNKACELVRKWAGVGHCLMVGFIKPHHPFDVPEKWSKMYDPAKMELLPGWADALSPTDIKFGHGFFDYLKLTPDAMKVIQSKYFGSITQIDNYVGKIVQILKEKGLYDQTMIIYTSDHGDYMGYHHMVLKGNYMYDPLMRVPLIVKYPHQKGKGGAQSQLVNIVDIAPTILDTADCMIPQQMWGIAQLLDSEEPRKTVCATIGGQYMARSKKYKLILMGPNDKGKKSSQFLDLEADPTEQVNLIADERYQKAIQDMKDQLLKWLAFDAPGIIYHNPDEPRLQASNVPSQDDGHIGIIKQYLTDRMKNFFTQTKSEKKFQNMKESEW